MAKLEDVQALFNTVGDGEYAAAEMIRELQGLSIDVMTGGDGATPPQLVGNIEGEDVILCVLAINTAGSGGTSVQDVTNQVVKASDGNITFLSDLTAFRLVIIWWNKSGRITA